jgi:hypothetical protein
MPCLKKIYLDWLIIGGLAAIMELLCMISLIIVLKESYCIFSDDNERK